LSLVSFFAGGTPSQDIIAADTDFPAKLGFWVVFAVFFPAVTGIEAGISMSGDLKNPAKSLPRGTLAAVLTGYAVYMAIPIFLAWMIRDERVLRVRPLIMVDIARWGQLILVGVFAATLSSALGAAACLLTMLMIDLGATLTALMVTGGLYTMMKRRQLKAHWGNMRYGILMLQENDSERIRAGGD